MGLVRWFLVEAVQRARGIELIEATTVTGVRAPGGDARVVLDSTAGASSADVVVGADGMHSVTRCFVAPEQPTARFAGYMLWRGLVSEAEIPGGLGGHGSNVEVHAAPGAQLVIYGVPGPDGRTDREHRRISYAWYDASRTALLRDTGCVEGDAVVGTLSSEQLPQGLAAELSRPWPAWPPPGGPPRG